jgi:hypothetical protein
MPKWLRLYVLTLLLLEYSGLAVQTPSAPADDPQVRSQIAQLEQLLPHTSDRGAALFLLAKQYTGLGDLPKAFSLLKECILLDEGFDPSGSQLLKPLRSYPEFPQLVGPGSSASSYRASRAGGLHRTGNRPLSRGPRGRH